MAEGADRRRWTCGEGGDDIRGRSVARLRLHAFAGAAVLYLTVAAAGCTSGAKPPAATPQSTSQQSAALSRHSDSTTPIGHGTVLIVGTSLTAGLGLDQDQAYPALLQHKVDSAGLPYRVINAGLSGETSAGALRRIGWLLRQPIAVFVLESGANDGLRGLDVDSTKAHIAAILDSVRRADPQAAISLVQMEAPPNLGPRYTRAFHDLYPAVARAQGATLLPFLLRGVAGESTLNQADGMHPNVTGERLVAATVWSGLEPVLRAQAAKQAVVAPAS
jgi:acyl-CoA thioesterase-1